MTLAARVAIVDDHQLLVQTLCLALEQAGFEPVPIQPSTDVTSAVAECAATLVLLDLQLGTQRDGIDLIRPLSLGGCSVIVLTGETDRAAWGTCLSEGAVGVLPKSSALEEVVAACVAAADGHSITRDSDRVEWLRAAERRRRQSVRNLAPFRNLTPREQAVLAALVDGDQAAVIAQRAVVSEATVRTQIRSVLSKLGVGSQLQAVAAARRAGWDGG